MADKQLPPGIMGGPKQNGAKPAQHPPAPVSQKVGTRSPSASTNGGRQAASVPPKPGTVAGTPPVGAVKPQTNGHTVVPVPPMSPPPIPPAPQVVDAEDTLPGVPLWMLPEDTEKIGNLAVFWRRALLRNWRGWLISLAGIVFLAFALPYDVLLIRGQWMHIGGQWWGLAVLLLGTYALCGMWAGKVNTRKALVMLTDPEGNHYPDWQKWWFEDDIRFAITYGVLFQYEDEAGNPQGKPFYGNMVDATEPEGAVSFYDVAYKAPIYYDKVKGNKGEDERVPSSPELMLTPLIEKAFRTFLNLTASRGRGTKMLIYIAVTAVSLIVLYWIGNQFSKTKLTWDSQRQAAAVTVPASGTPAQATAIIPTAIPQQQVPAQPVDPRTTPQ